jgi:hypothetical protein
VASRWLVLPGKNSGKRQVRIGLQRALPDASCNAVTASGSLSSLL